MFENFGTLDCFLFMLSTILLWYYSQILLGNVSPVLIKDYIVVESLIVGVDPQISVGIAEAESGLNPEAIGDHNTSYGLFQIHNPKEKGLTVEQAKSIISSTEWSMQEMKKNGCKAWSTCKAVKYQLRANLSEIKAYNPDSS